MKTLRTYVASLLLVLFCSYLTGISMFSHIHLVHGATVVHSHFGGTSEHSHSDGQYAVIDVLSHFQSEAASDCQSTSTPLFLTSEIHTEYIAPEILSGASSVLSLRGPPQC